MRILIVEDQGMIGRAIQKGLTEEGYVVDWANSVMEGLHLVSEFEFDALILDLMLPDGSGLDLLAFLRKADTRTPVLILSARDTLADKAEGFRAGTDDYLTKPFAFEELLARVRALTRRKYQFHGHHLEAGGLRLDVLARTAEVAGKPLALTAKELAVIEIFLHRRGHVLSREKISSHLYAETTEQGSNVIDVFVNKLRRKLESAGAGSLIETVRGEGYVIR
jgi:DNA-binding response OmpR family regulator